VQRSLRKFRPPPVILLDSTVTATYIRLLTDDVSIMQNLQSPLPPADEQSTKRAKRPRAAQACDRCRLKKYKCDEQYPCLHCKSRFLADQATFQWALTNILQKATLSACTRAIIESAKAVAQQRECSTRIMFRLTGPWRPTSHETNLLTTRQLCRRPREKSRGADITTSCGGGPPSRHIGNISCCPQNPHHSTNSRSRNYSMLHAPAWIHTPGNSQNTRGA
jgi:hypothetical protein